MATIADMLTPVIAQRGIPVQVYTVQDGTKKTITCPCVTNSPWHRYDPQWHQANPIAPDCKGTGQLVEISNEAPTTEIQTIQAVVIPNYGATGLEVEALLPSKVFSWNWLAVTQATAVFNRLSFTDGANNTYMFQVENKMPYYLENDLSKPAVIIYVLIPLQAGVDPKGA